MVGSSNMKLEYSTYTYVPVERVGANVVRQSSANQVAEATVFRKQQLQLLVEKLSRRHPDWLFVVPSTAPEYVYVFCGEEYLGCAGYAYEMSMGGDVFFLDNKRLAAARSWKRKNKTANYTKDMNKALRIIKDSFIPQNTQEFADAACAKITSAVAAKASHASKLFSNVAATMSEQINKFIIDNWEAFAASDPLMDQSRFPQLHEQNLQLARFSTVFSLSTRSAFHSYAGVFVAAYKGGYLCGDRWINEGLKPVDVQDFSDELKLKFAMLKMAQDDEFIPDTGMRINKDLFFILTTEVV